jgi:hypothetical protein
LNIHHVDGNRMNDEPENLAATHISCHGKMTVGPMKASFLGRKHLPETIRKMRASYRERLKSKKGIKTEDE